MIHEQSGDYVPQADFPLLIPSQDRLLPDCRRTGHDLLTGQFGGLRNGPRGTTMPRKGRPGLMLGAGFLALRVQVGVAEEFGNRVRV